MHIRAVQLVTGWLVWGGIALAGVSAQSPAPIIQPPDAPASQGVVRLAPAGPAVLPPLRAHGMGACRQPMPGCYGPSYATCRPLIYYGTNPRDDDWTNPLYECAGGRCGQGWYSHALNMVRRKKEFAEHVAH